MAKIPTISAPEEPTFEDAIERLDQIVEQMESDKLPLEEVLLRYEEGIKLVRVCEQKLQNAENRIQMITRDAAGEPQLSEFEPETKSPPAEKENVSLF